MHPAARPRHASRSSWCRASANGIQRQCHTQPPSNKTGQRSLHYTMRIKNLTGCTPTACKRPAASQNTGCAMTISDYQDRITIEPGKRSGKPCIRKMRITVYDVLDYLASGMSEQEVLDDFPELEKEDIRACLAFAADRERRLMSGTAP
jgi:uncharacterized protein (DUF433 family)